MADSYPAGRWLTNQKVAHTACLEKAPLPELSYWRARGQVREARPFAASRKHNTHSSARSFAASRKHYKNSSELDGQIFYAVLTMYKNHATRCMTIKKTWGARLPWDHLIFYSDRAETVLPLNVVALADSNLPENRMYDDAQDRFTYRVMPHAAGKLAALNMSWLLLADDDTFVWPENLQHLVVPYDPRRWIWLGQRCPLFEGRRSFCGGAGFVMSAALASVATCVLPLCKSLRATQREKPYDRVMGICLEELLHIRVADVPEFNSQPPHFYMTKDGQSDRPYGFGAAVTFHYLKTDLRPVTPEQHYEALWRLTRAGYPHSMRSVLPWAPLELAAAGEPPN